MQFTRDSVDNEPSIEGAILTPNADVASDGSRLFTYGQVPSTRHVTGKPVLPQPSSEELRVVPATRGVELNVPTECQTLAEAQALLREWRGNKLAFLAWLTLTGIFAAFYIIYLEDLYLALGAGVVLTVITCALYFSPWFKSSDGIFTILAFMVGTFMADFVCAFLTLVFGLHDATVLGCGALIFTHGSVTLFFFQKYKGVMSAAEKVERSTMPEAVVPVADQRTSYEL